MARARVSSDALGKAVGDGVFDEGLCEAGVMSLHEAPGAWFGLVEALEAATTRARLAGRMTDGQGTVLCRYLLAFASAVGVGKGSAVLDRERLRRSLEPLHAPVLANLRTRRVEFRGALADLTPLMMAEDERLADVVLGECVGGCGPGGLDEAFLLRLVSRYAALAPDAAMRAVGRYAARPESRGGALSLLHALVCLDGEGGGAAAAAALGPRAFALALEVLMTSSDRAHLTTALWLIVVLLPMNARRLGARLSDLFHVLSRLPALMEAPGADAAAAASAADAAAVAGGAAAPSAGGTVGGSGGSSSSGSTFASPVGGGGGAGGGEGDAASVVPPPPLRESYGLLLQHVYAIAPSMFVDTMRAACDASPWLAGALAPHLDSLRLLPGVLARADMDAAAGEWERATPDEVVERVFSALVVPPLDARAERAAAAAGAVYAAVHSPVAGVAAATAGAGLDEAGAAGGGGVAMEATHQRLLELHRSLWRPPVTPPDQQPQLVPLPRPMVSSPSPPTSAPRGGGAAGNACLTGVASPLAPASTITASAARAAASVALLQQECVFQRHLRLQVRA